MAVQFNSLGLWSKVPIEVKKNLLASFYLTVLTTLIATIYYFIAQPELPFFYTLPLPEQALGSKEWLFFFPVLSFFITLTHMIIISVYHDLSPLILKLFASMTAMAQVIQLLALLRIILITF
ncbi:MAG: hypothetical protein COY81_02630 [Candidatus Pacebacteria bacterium CG_4_10_14_0_8_um_filter_43_12]|nr:MAG: hypothetical protein COU66_00880 [Candidatus Pacebacteria bacterium CG10_big_fil_rev_8_21_14_0_10_44_11]PIY79437.1 MAG: hypothetical protein COY81_02630 [Candidatus Pacebacteria bacterium CG_4_10_14_0_8_um_filter_43_12]